MKKPGYLRIVLLFVFFPLIIMESGGCSRKNIPSRMAVKSSNSTFNQKELDAVTIITPNHIHNLSSTGQFRWACPGEELGIERMDGLHPEDYHLQAIEYLLEHNLHSDTVTPANWFHLDLLMTDAYRRLASHLAKGKTDQKAIDPKWHAARRDLLFEQDIHLDSILASGSIIPSLYRLTPHHREYLNLRRALARYRKIEKTGGWQPFVTQLEKLEKGIKHPDAARLRRRLSIEQGAIKPDTDDETRFDSSLDDQARLFQQRNSLVADGIMGKLSIDALNIPIEKRIQANLERWRWLTGDPDRRYIVVNIANFNLEVIDQKRCIFSSPTIVGRPYRQTPVFSAQMTHIIINPEWTVPPTILSEDVIPEVIQNPSYLTKHKMKVFSYSGSEVDPAAIDWNKALHAGFPYVIRQKSGSHNSLGRIKFLFSNPYNVYLHDTPSRSLFLRNERTFSSGCIRLYYPVELATLLLEDQPDFDAQKIRKIMEEGKPKTISLKHPITIHVIYMTAWADENGIAGFGNDVYHRDPQLINALNRR